MQDQRVTEYLSSHDVKRLQIGCGVSVLPEWLNVDIYPQSEDVVEMDATKPFAFSDGSFDLVFSEHTIEHMPYKDGAFMLTECFRVLKPGGRVRITTPNLENIIHIFQNPTHDLYRRYIRWSLQHFVSDAPSDAPGFFFNHFVRGWGHMFIYDRRTLEVAFLTAGFKNVQERMLNESDEGHFRDLETLRRMPEGFLQLESLTYEGIKPA